MAGRPKKREHLKTIAAAGGEDAVFARVAEGATIKALAGELGVPRSFLSTWCNADRRVDRYARARREAAQSHAEEGMEIADAAEPENAQVAKLRSDYRRWMAARMDPRSWGEAKAAQVNIDMGQMHLEAVKELGRADAPRRERSAITLDNGQDGPEQESQTWAE